MPSVKYFITRVQEKHQVTVIKGKVALKQPQINVRSIQRSYYNDLSLHYFQVYNKDLHRKEIRSLNEISDKEMKRATRFVMYDYNDPSPLRYDKQSETWQKTDASKEEVDRILKDQIMKDNVEVSAMSVFMLDPQIIRITIILSVVGILVGLPLNSIFHMFPDTLIHWIP